MPKSLLRFLLLVALAAGLVFGANALWILVDDAFITFRYVANARDGHGLVWNPPPFAPVEGYTSLTWELALWATWSWLGVEPPHAANVLSVLCGLGSLVVLATAAFGLRHRDGARVGDVVVFVALAAIVGNRTFLQWLTGGLDTALFNLCVLTWCVLAFRGVARRTTGWLATWAMAAALVALTRPDGLLMVAATSVAAAAGTLRRERSWRATLLGLSPLAAVAAQFSWRRWFYGEWLPNTYYAKVGAPWPEAGVHYLACFSFEHGVWLWLLLATWWLVSNASSGLRARLRNLAAHVPAVLAVSAIVAHVGYYTLRVGGDHFDYRMVSHLVPLLGLSAAAMAAHACRSSGAVVAWLSAGWLAAAVGWLHLALTDFRQPPGYDPLSRHVPAWAKPVARWYDRHRLWLQCHFICMRFLHGTTTESLLALVPPRRRSAFDLEDVPVAKFSAVGMYGWVLPDVAVIDVLGLNDWVVARHKPGHWRASPAPLVQAVLATADADADGLWTREELRASFRAIPGNTENAAGDFVDMLLLLFAEAHDDRLTREEVAATGPFFADLRLMLHECEAPPGYVEAFDPNVTVAGREVIVRPRERPLRADDVRAIEAEWRARVSNR